MNLYDQDETNRITKLSETNDKLEDFFTSKVEKWNTSVSPLFDTLKASLTLDSAPKIMDLQSLALSYRQILNEEISFYLNRRNKEIVKVKKLKQDKFVFYALNFGIKTNMGEKAILIDAHIAENIRGLELIENHVEFLRSTSKNLEAIGFSVKHSIDLMVYLSR